MNKPNTCPVSGETMERAFAATVLRKHRVNYYFCRGCGFLNTEKPYWLEEAYQDAIADTDTGLVQRNLSNRSALEPILQCLFGGQGKFLDVAGGYGLLARLLRDIGFDCYTTDPYCENLFAKAFEPGEGFAADALFAFEALEHIEDPKRFVSDLFTTYGCKTLIFSTCTFSGDVPMKDWWYYSFETGQHISFYQPKTLASIAESLGTTYYAVNPNLHIITDMGLRKSHRIFLFHPGIRKFYAFFVRRSRMGLSKTWNDHLLMKGLGDGHRH